MPFRAGVFRENVRRLVAGTARDRLLEACREYGALTTPQQRARSIQGMMAVLDREVDEETGRAIMEACGRTCISAGTVAKARRLHREANDLDDLLCRLNEAHIGGGQLRREGDVIFAAYEGCYCGSVSHTRESIELCHLLPLLVWLVPGALRDASGATGGGRAVEFDRPGPRPLRVCDPNSGPRVEVEHITQRQFRCAYAHRDWRCSGQAPSRRDVR